MEKYKAAIYLFTFFILLSLSACGSKTQGSAVQTIAPLNPPNYEEADVAKFIDADPLGKNENNYYDFIFKGKINQLYEIQISRSKVSEKDSIVSQDWFSVCDISIGNIVYGTAPGGKDRIKVVFGQSTRRLDRAAFLLSEGKEYYFITHIFDQEDEKKNSTIRELGDANGGVYYTLFPVNNGTVSYQGWPFEKTSTTSTNRLGEIAGTIDEKDFMDQFIAMIQYAKNKPGQVPETTGGIAVE